TVATGAFAVGNISGAAFNPAVAFGAMLMGVLNWGNFYIYLIGNLLGAAVAAIAFAYLNPDDVLEGPLARRPGLAAPTVTATATAPATRAAPATPAPGAGPTPSQAAPPADGAAGGTPTA
ncbi:MAG TPA: aquaporin, partial [Streptosporangiaceae bacterium]